MKLCQLIKQSTAPSDCKDSDSAISLGINKLTYNFYPIQTSTRAYGQLSLLQQQQCDDAPEISRCDAPKESWQRPNLILFPNIFIQSTLPSKASRTRSRHSRRNTSCADQKDNTVLWRPQSSLRKATPKDVRSSVSLSSSLD